MGLLYIDLKLFQCPYIFGNIYCSFIIFDSSFGIVLEIFLEDCLFEFHLDGFLFDPVFLILFKIINELLFLGYAKTMVVSIKFVNIY